MLIQTEGGGKQSDERALGSGVIIRDDGTILTANHVVDGARIINVTFSDGTKSRADVVQAILDCKPVPEGATEDDRLAIDVSREMARGHKLSPSTFEAARKRLGDAGLVDLLACVGYFAMLAVTHKALEVFPEGT